MGDILGWLKIILIVVLAVLAFIFGKQLIEYIKGVFGGGGSYSSGGGPMDEAEKVNISANDKKYLRYTDAQLHQYAVGLFNIMNGFGCDDSKISEILNQLNDREFEIVFNKFGRCPYLLGQKQEVFGTLMSLTEWFKNKCNPKTYLKIKSRFDSARVVFP